MRADLKPYVLECLTSAELGLALGRENVIHAAVQPGGFAERLTLDAERLNGLRAGNESPRAKTRERMRAAKARERTRAKKVSYERY